MPDGQGRPPRNRDAETSASQRPAQYAPQRDRPPADRARSSPIRDREQHTARQETGRSTSADSTALEGIEKWMPSYETVPPGLGRLFQLSLVEDQGGNRSAASRRMPIKHVRHTFPIGTPSGAANSGADIPSAGMLGRFLRPRMPRTAAGNARSPCCSPGAVPPRNLPARSSAARTHRPGHSIVSGGEALAGDAVLRHAPADAAGLP